MSQGSGAGGGRRAAGVAARCRRAVVRGVGLALLLASLAAPGAAAPRGVFVVVNALGPVGSPTDEQLRDVYLGYQRALEGVPVRPVQLGGSARASFLRAVLGMSEREFQLHWMRRSYELGLLPPPVLDTAGDVMRFVASEQGAVGFVDAASYRPLEGVRLVREIATEERP